MLAKMTKIQALEKEHRQLTDKHRKLLSRREAPKTLRDVASTCDKTRANLVNGVWEKAVTVGLGYELEDIKTLVFQSVAKERNMLHLQDYDAFQHQERQATLKELADKVLTLEASCALRYQVFLFTNLSLDDLNTAILLQWNLTWTQYMAVQHTLFYDYFGPETLKGGGDGEQPVDCKMGGCYIKKSLFDDPSLNLPTLSSQYAVLREGRGNDKAVNLKAIYNEKLENIGACISVRDATIGLLHAGVVNLAGASMLGLDVQACSL